MIPKFHLKCLKIYQHPQNKALVYLENAGIIIEPYSRFTNLILVLPMPIKFKPTQ